MEYTQKENILIQSYFTTAFLTELHSLDFLNSEYYKNASFKDKFIKENLPEIGIDNQGTMLIFLYTMLVIPKQLLENDFPDEFKALNTTIDRLKSKAESNYDKDSNGINYIKHIRNAVAHARVDFIPEKTVTFTDKNGDAKCAITIPLKNIGEFLNELQAIFVKYIEKLKVEIKN